MKDRLEYYKWLTTLPSGYCSFCDYKNVQEIIKESKHWVWHLSISPVWRYHTMLTPKRHVTKLSDLTAVELKEMVKFHQEIIDIYKNTVLLDSNGHPFDKYEMLWRHRENTHDNVTGNIKPDHLHLNIYPFRDHHTDPVMERDAYLFDLRDKIRII